METAATVRTELALSGLFRVVSILQENFRDVKTSEEMKPLNDFVDYKIEALIREAKSDDLVKLMPLLEELQAAALELEDLLDFYEYDQIKKQVSSSSSSEYIPKEKVLPTHLRNGLDKLLMIVEQVENKRQSITSKAGTSQPQADTITPTMELAAKVGTELALSGLFRVMSILDENFRDVKTTEEMKPLTDFIEYKIEALIREAKSDDLIQLMPLLEELQATALEMEDRLDLDEYEQIEKQVNSFSSKPIPKEKVLPTHLRDGLNKLLKIVERVETIRQSITSKTDTTKSQADTVTPTTSTLLSPSFGRENQCNSFTDFLVSESHIALGICRGRVKRNIGEWMKGKQIGSGSFGTVYEAMNATGDLFAVKEVSLLDQGGNAQECISQLEREIALLSQFEHENIVQYYGTDKKDAKLFIFIEYVTQGSLVSLYQKYRLKDSQVSAYTKQILKGLNYLHEQNIVHRDIKCANILINADGTVKVADFGLAKQMSKFNKRKSFIGSAYWMAPEVSIGMVRPTEPYGPAADIWSLGCTVIEMLTQKLPFPDNRWITVLVKVAMGGGPPIPSDLSEDARDFIVQCVQSDPAKRPTASQLLEHPYVK